MLFIHIPNPDYFGHRSGWMSEPYLFELGNTDAQIGRLLDALDALGIRETSLLLITSDHGGHGTVHGANIPEDMTIPLIVNGVGVQPGTLLSGTEITQVAPTVLWALGLAIPDGMARPLTQAFGDE